ncbi:MAG: nicotianamine synthase family protein [Pseudomonadota bacterium]
MSEQRDPRKPAARPAAGPAPGGTPAFLSIQGRMGGPDADAVYEIKSTVLGAWNVLKDATDLSPRNPLINMTLSTLVNTLAQRHDVATVRAVVDDPEIREIMPSMWSKLSVAEGQMEAFWADHFNRKRGGVSVDDLNEFIYRDNYDELTKMELGHWRSKGDGADKDSHIFFVGSGPLPLTAIDYHLKTGAKVTCVDNDPNAVAQSRALIRKLGLDNHIDVVQKAGDEVDYSNASHVVVAALVMNQPKVVRHVLEDNPSALLGVRSASGLRTILYPPADTRSLKAIGLESTGASPINERVINTLLTFRPGPKLDLDALPPAAKKNCATCDTVDCDARRKMMGL